MTKIMVVEDNMTLLESIAFELEMQDYDVVQAMDGQSAINQLEQMSSLPDIIVSDIAMPELDGYKLLELVRHNEAWQSIPLIFLTAFDSKNSIRISKELGVDDYLVKPFDPDDLIIAVENKLKRQEVFREEAERRLDDVRRELVNLISHELRTPLTAIYGSTDMLEMSLSDMPDELTQKLLKLLRSGADRLHHLVERIVLQVQIESGRIHRMYDVISKTEDLNAIVLNRVTRIENDPNYDVNFSIGLAANPLPVHGIEKFLQLAVDELLENAFKFSPANAAHVDIETRSNKGFAQIIISDQGCGIPEDQIDKVWERFVQIDREKQEQQGIGIGLFLVKALVDLHGGFCEISSQFKLGTIVTISLPLAEDN
jgi:signal transduction histidine kinase